MKNKFLTILAVCLLTAPMVANAMPVTIDIVPSAGSTWTMTGSFDLNPSTSTYSNLTINLTWAAGPGFNNTPCDTCPSAGSTAGLIDTTLLLTYFLQDFTVTFGGGSLDAIFRGNSFSLESSSGRFDGTYAFVSDSGPDLPEPGTLALFGLGLAGLGFSRRRKTA